MLAATPNPAPARSRAENPAFGPASTRNRMPDQMPASKLTPKMRAAGSATAAGAGMAPFLTRPYWAPHTVTSVFDHCNPDYTHDGRVCEFDGTVATSSNGVDPYFAAGYAITRGGTDYLYYDGHNGWDLALNYEPLMAAAPGVIQIAGYDPYNPGFGQTVTIDHGNGFTTRYAHMSSISVASGEAVQRGQSIGVSGNTGTSTGPHLHFGLYLTSPWTAIDPWGWTGGYADPWPADAGNAWLTGNPQDPVPTAPTGVTAVAGDSTITVSWTAPTFNGGEPITGYTVTASLGGASVQVPATQTSAVFSSLPNFAAYTFTVTASTAIGTSPQSPASAAVTPAAAFPGRQHPLAPARILDTRTGQGGFGTVAPGEAFSLPVLGSGGIPGSGVSAVTLNVTVTNPTQAGFVTIYPSASAIPNTSNVNYGPGQTAATLTEVRLGSDGKVGIYNGSQSFVDVLVDVTGWVSTASSAGPDGHYRALPPARVMDTRTGAGVRAGPVGPNSSVNLSLLGQGGLPAAGVGGVVLNLTATNASRSSYLSVYPAGAPPSQFSNLNFRQGATVANRVFVPLGAGGQVTIYNSEGTTDAIADVVGWFTDGTGASAGGLFTGVAPARVMDTRDGTGGASRPAAPNSWLTLPLAGRGGIPAMTASTPPRAVVLNLTATNPSLESYLAVDPTGSAVRASDLNFSAGATVANLVVATLGADGRVHVYNSQGSVDVIADVVGWFS